MLFTETKRPVFMTDFATLIRVHLDRYPIMNWVDVYKLLHQATFGVGHKVARQQDEREWLEHDFKVNSPNANEMLIEVISPDERWLRLHLRPYMAAGGGLEPLLEAYSRSALVRQGSADQMAERWAAFEEMVAQGSNDQWPLWEVRLFGRMQRDQKWPAVQHSPAFFQAYDPIYRIMTAEDAHQLCERQRITITMPTR